MNLSNEQSYWLKRAADVGSNYGLDPIFFSSLIGSESSWRAYNPSGTGPTGLGQFIKSTADEYGVTRGNPESELDGAARYIKDLIARAGGDLREAVYAYKGFGASQSATQGAISGWQHLQNLYPLVSKALGNGLSAMRPIAPPDPANMTPQQIYNNAVAGNAKQVGDSPAVHILMWLLVVTLIILGVYKMVQ